MAPDISIVMLCYRTGERIRAFVDKTIKSVTGLIPSWEIILVGNYLENTDDITPEIVKDIASKNQNIKAVTRVKEGMMGWDARTGLEKATGKYICLIDGDEQMPPEDIVRAYKKIKDENLDFVTTYRLSRDDGIMRRINSSLYNLIFSLLFPGIKIRDVNSKPKVFRKEAYDELRLTSNDWFLDAEMVIQAKRLKFKIGEVPTKFYKCPHRKSFVKFHTIFEFIKNLLIAKFRQVFNICQSKLFF
jgi:glycosyltransferase involved in cell wall biosynthesis